MQSASTEGFLHAFHGPGQECTRCHLFHAPDTLRAGSERFRVTSLEECVACHVPGKPLSLISAGHRAARVLYHSDRTDFDFNSPSDVCLTCHSRTPDADARIALASVGPIDPPRFHVEASHPYGIEVPLGEGTVQTGIRMQLDPRIRLFDGRIECVTCHDLTEEGDDRLVRFESKYDLCTGCHRGGGMRDAALSFTERLTDR